MFSITTIESSTTRPMATVSAARVRMFRVKPPTQSPIRAISSDSGIEIAVISVGRSDCRNSRITNTAIAKGGLGTLLEEAEELAVVRKQIKQREDSAEQFRSAGRPELAEKEEAEIAVLKQFMPAELTAEETAAILETVMKETGASTKKDMGQVMKLMQERTAGRVNGKELARMVSARLS